MSINLGISGLEFDRPVQYEIYCIEIISPFQVPNHLHVKHFLCVGEGQI